MWKLFLTLLVSCGSGLRNSNRKVSLNDEPNQVLPTETTNKVHQLGQYGNFQNKSTSQIIKIKEIKGIFIYQLVKFKISMFDENVFVFKMIAND